VKAVGLWKLLLWLVPLLARQWPRVVEARAGADLVGDQDRDRAAGTLREQYARGYLTLEELTRRIPRVVTARSRRDLRRALSGLSQEVVPRAPELNLRRALLVVFSGAYFVFTFTLLLLLALIALIQGISTAGLLVFLIVWLVPTYLLTRIWRGKPVRRRT
jgi:hypothetical protein